MVASGMQDRFAGAVPYARAFARVLERCRNAGNKVRLIQGDTATGPRHGVRRRGGAVAL